VIGLNMVNDLLLGAGYDTFLLGADVPLVDLAQTVGAHRIDVVAMTATLAQSAERVDAAIDYLRAVPNSVGILLGGQAISFELGALWHATVCQDLGRVVGSVDALVQRAPFN
jgi:methanogenic corrinoid protein MtbC1